MKSLRPSITALLAIVALSGLAFAALRSASDLWFSAFYTATTLLLLWSVLEARFRRGGERAFWFGFAVFGWGFFLLAMGPWKDMHEAVTQGTALGYNSNMITHKLIRFLAPRMRKQADDLDILDKITVNTIGIAHLLVSLTFALFGGIVGALMWRRRRSATPAGRSGASRALVVLAGLAVLPALASLGDHARPPVRFFPDPLAHGQIGMSEFRTDWYSRALVAMNEPSLWERSQRDRDATAYRLLWLPSFHHPVCVRIDGAELQAVVLDGIGGYEPGMVATDRRIKLSQGQRDGFVRQVEKVKFWTMPTTDGGNHGTDGDRLILEGVRDGQYRMVDWEEPDADYLVFCRYLLDLTGLDSKRVWGEYHGEGSGE